METPTSVLVNCMLLALKSYPLRVYVNDSNLSAFNRTTDVLNFTTEPVRSAEYVIHENDQKIARFVLFLLLSFCFFVFVCVHLILFELNENNATICQFQKWKLFTKPF